MSLNRYKSMINLLIDDDRVDLPPLPEGTLVGKEEDEVIGQICRDRKVVNG